MMIVWDGSVKPIWSTLRSHPIEVEGWEINTARFRAVPYQDANEYTLYNAALVWFIEEYGYSPITIGDFRIIQSLIEEAVLEDVDEEQDE